MKKTIPMLLWGGIFALILFFAFNRVVTGEDPEEVLEGGNVWDASEAYATDEAVTDIHVRDNISSIRTMLFDASNAISHLASYKEIANKRSDLKKAEALVDRARKILFDIQ